MEPRRGRLGGGGGGTEADPLAMAAGGGAGARGSPGTVLPPPLLDRTLPSRSKTDDRRLCGVDPVLAEPTREDRRLDGSLLSGSASSRACGDEAHRRKAWKQK